MSYSATIELPTVKFGVVEATRATWTGPLVAAVPRLVTVMVGWIVSPGCMVGGTFNAVARSSGRAWPATWTGIGGLTLLRAVGLQHRAGGVDDQVDEERARRPRESLGAGRERERLGDLLEAVLRDRRGLERADRDGVGHRLAAA